MGRYVHTYSTYVDISVPVPAEKRLPVRIRELVRIYYTCVNDVSKNVKGGEGGSPPTFEDCCCVSKIRNVKCFKVCRRRPSIRLPLLLEEACGGLKFLC